MRYALEVNVWEEWSPEPQIFLNIAEASAYGQSHFSQNGWRIVDHRGDVLYAYDPMGAVREAATQDIQRFENTIKWRERFAHQKERRMERVREERVQEFMASMIALREERLSRWSIVHWLKEGF
jgi:hypothetical protein